ncbi:MAG: hypothetical protein RIT25_1895 [Planctomycetota bacterium]
MVPATLPLLRLLRAGTLFSPAADVVAGLCLGGVGLALGGAKLALAGVCTYAAGMVLNDFADRKVDAELRRERPIPRGEVQPAFALVLGAALLALAVLLSPSPAYHGVLAALVLGYDFVLKRSILTGAITMGVLRAMNLCSPLLLLDDVPEVVRYRFLVAASAYFAYIVAVTFLGHLEDEQKVRARTVQALQVAPPVAALAALIAVQGALWPAPAIAMIPVLAFSGRNKRVREWDQAAIRGSMTWLLLGTMLYTSLLCVAVGNHVAGAAIALAIVPARRIARTISLT